MMKSQSRENKTEQCPRRLPEVLSSPTSSHDSGACSRKSDQSEHAPEPNTLELSEEDSSDIADREHYNFMTTTTFHIPSSGPV